MKNASLSLVIVCSFAFYSQAQNTYIWKPQDASTSAKVISNWKIATCNGSTATIFPGSSDTLLFSNCSGTNATIDTPMNVRFVNVKSNYTGTVTLSGSNTLTAEKMRVTGGTFSGGSGTLNISSSLSIDGGIFSSTSGTFTLAGNFTKSSGTFNHNNGTVVFKKASSGQPTIAGSSITAAVDFYDVIFDAPDATTLFNINSIYFTVNHSLTISGDEQLFINGDTILMAGSSNLTLSNTSGTGGGTADIKFNSSSTQTITGSTGSDYTKLPNIIIAKSGTLNLSGNIGMGGTTYLDYRSGTIGEGSSSFLFYHDNTIKGKMEFYDVEFQGHSSDYYLTDTIVIGNDLLMTGTAVNTVNNGAIKLNQDLTYTNSHSSSIFNSTILFSNLTQDQSIAGSFTARVYDIEIKGGKTLILQNPLIISHSLKLTSGFIKSTSTNLLTLSAACIVSGGSSSSFIKGPVKKVGNTAFTFPLGGESSFKPLSISAPGSASDAFIAEYFPTIQPMGLTRSGLTYTSMCEYWNLSRTTGSSNVTVTLSWDSYSCDVYTLSTLKIGRWNGSAWADVGSVTTSGNTTAGTITTSSSQSSFGDFLIAKNSPAVTANAGSDANIDLGQSTTLGGSPSASGGTSPYTYQWVTDYGLSSTSVANPSASPFASLQYYLKVTDADLMVDIDEVQVTINGFELGPLTRFPLLADGSISVSSPVHVVGAVGSNDDVDDDITATDEIFISTSEVTDAVTALDDAMDIIDGLSANTISGSLGGNTYTGGIYRISGNATLSGTLTLDGDESSYFVFDIGGTFAFANGASIVLEGVTKQQVFFNVGSDISIPSGSATLNGYFFGREDFTGNVANGNLSVQVLGEINGDFPLLKNLLIASLKGTPRNIDHFMGYNGTNTTKASYGWSDIIDNKGFPTEMPKLAPGLLRYPGGTVSNWWNWQTGWWRGYNNPLYNNALSYPVIDKYPLPEYATDGLPWDNNASIPLENKLEEFKVTLDACTAFPILNLNLLTSDLGTQIGALFATRCMDIPTKYIELGNEFYLNGDESAIAFPQPADYAATAEQWATAIKEIFPDVKIAAVASASKTNISNPPDRRSYWNINDTDPATGITGLFNTLDLDHVDALTFHIYPWIGLKDNEVLYNQADLNHASYADLYDGPNGMFSNILAEPFRLEHTLETQISPQPQFNINEEYNLEKEIWVTEYNQEEDFYNFTGRWLHSLFTAGLTLGFLSNPDVTHVTCQTMFSAADQGAYFSSAAAYPSGNNYPSSTELWELAATGYGLKYLGMAMKHTHYADQLQFGSVSKIYDVMGNPYDGVIGWMFSDRENFNMNDSLIAVIINFTDAVCTVSVSSLFPLGGTCRQMSPPTGATIYDGALTFLTGATNEVNESALLPFSYGSLIELPEYSITLLKGTWDNMPVSAIAHVIAESSNPSVCSGGEATIYVSGAEKYYIDPPVNNQSVFDGPTIVVSPTTTTEYHIAGWVDNPAFVSAYIDPPVTITVSTAPSFSIEVIPCDLTPCPCAGDARLIELQSATEDLKYNWMPRNADDAVSAISSTESHLLLHPEVTTTYTISATDGICFCSEQTLTIEVSEPANAGPDVYVCSDFIDDDAVSIGYDPQDNLGFHNFVWTYSSGSLSDDEIANPYFTTLPMVTTTYTLTDNGFCESEDEVTVHVLDCCEGTDPEYVFDPFDPTYTQGSYLTAWDLAQIVCPSCITDNGVSGYSLDDEAVVDYGNEIVINGPFYINMNLTLKDCDKIYFGPDAEVIIEPNCQLKLSRKTYLQAGCNQMWKGIKIEGNLREDDGLVLTTNNANNPLIKDAVTGINATKDSRIKISDGDFENNHVHISMSNYAFGLAHVIRDASFTSNSTTMLSPFANTQTASAFRLNDIPSTADNNGNALIVDNNIDHADVGIDAVNTGLVVSGNDLAQHTIQSVGTGIRSVDAQGSQKITDYVIEDCDNGIIIIETNGNKTEIFSNTITTNAIDEGNGIYPVGIYINNYDNLGFTSTGKIDVGAIDLGNTIFSNGETAIEVNGTVDSKVDYNEIKMDQGASTNKLWGIKATDANGISVSDNKINDPDYIGYDCSEVTCELDNKTAISITTSQNVTAYCNRMNATYTALQFIDACGPSKIRGNTFIVHEDAYVLGDGTLVIGADIGNQVSADNNGNPELPGNYWKGTDDGTESSPHTITGETHTFYTSNPPANFQTNLEGYSNGFYYPSANLQDNGTAISPNEVSSLNPWTCNPVAGLIGEDDFNLALSESIADDSYTISVREPEFRYNLKRGLYVLLRKNPDLIGSSTTLRNFYDTIQTGNTGLLYTVDSLIALLNDTTVALSTKEQNRLQAIMVNQLISPSTVIESNLQTTNNVYLATLANHIFAYTTEQNNDLSDVATQCPFEGGVAVFKARGMLKIADVTLHWNDETLCATAPRQSDTSNTELNKVNIFPNPGGSIVTVTFQFSDDKDKMFELYDMAGRKKLEFQLPNKNNQVNFDIGTIISGLHFYKVSYDDDDESIITGKLTIIH